jgi:hypothetical protein
MDEGQNSDGFNRPGRAHRHHRALNSPGVIGPARHCSNHQLSALATDRKRSPALAAPWPPGTGPSVDRPRLAADRAIAEVGAIIIVGGNIRGYTRSMTTTIALETSRGDLSLALALGIILLALSMAVRATSLHFGPA